MSRSLREVVFVDGVRTPFGKAGPKGIYAETRADDLVVRCIRELVRRNPALPPERIDARACSSAAINSSASRQRCAGSFASARITTCSSTGSSFGRTARSGGGSSLTCLSAIDTALSPVNGTSPASIS